MQQFYIYQLTNPITGEPIYIGKGSGIRAYRHETLVRLGKVHPNKLLQSFI
jgi:hypothetical protein